MILDSPAIYSYPFPGHQAVYAVAAADVDRTCREIGGTAPVKYLACTIRFSAQVCFTVLPRRASVKLRHHENARCNGMVD